MATADFLASLTDPIALRFRNGFESKASRTDDELEKAYLSSPTCQVAFKNVQEYEESPLRSGTVFHLQVAVF
ncbi:hypothetical protein K458DRAFT_420384 [Lentithecium fluviatile CBS 122367]|uniref:Uncharacterized protein n=1 Tax=Lentithecium fluviatile CBS 122367 TaxID=1168545 RepID=A0A6G1IUJ0_9PLEO|nr:hypothetical protein K458DRAFT_420384 [Lentithecium fluviatile CBS 122367]